MIIQILAHSLPFIRNFPGLLRLSLVFSLSHQTFFGCGSVPQSCPALCHPMAAAHQASLSFTVSLSLLKLMSIESLMTSNHLILCCPLLLLPLIFACILVFSTESVLHIRWPEDWSFSLSISPSNEYSGLISFRID